jgi:aldehyde dehydrogenase (NAD+)
MVGKLIMKAAAEHLTPLTLELGGKSPCLIEESANLDSAAKRIVWGKFLNAGQTCVAPDYVLVPRKLQASLIDRLRFHLEAFYGKDIKASESYSKIVNEKHFDRLAKLILPAKVVLGSESDRSQRYIAPTVMKDVSWSDSIMEDEIFGPLLPIIPYDSLEEAIDAINRRPKPLAFYLFSENSTLQNKIMIQVSFGGACINDTVLHLANPNLPFGGVGESGMGSYHGQKSFDTFSHFKAIFKRSALMDIPLRYPPYRDSRLKWIKKLLG